MYIYICIYIYIYMCIYLYIHQCVLNQVYVFNSWLGRVNSEPILKTGGGGTALEAWHIYIYIYIYIAMYIHAQFRTGLNPSFMKPHSSRRWFQAVRALLPVARGVGHFKWRCRWEKSFGNSGVGWGKLEPWDVFWWERSHVPYQLALLSRWFSELPEVGYVTVIPW